MSDVEGEESEYEDELARGELNGTFFPSESLLLARTLLLPISPG
jgi:hypothetical protein